jgi:hypothetical protein
MKMMKLALLGGAALAVTSAGAFADDLDALKSSIESVGVVAAPVADAPAGATVTWGGELRQALTYGNMSYGTAINRAGTDDWDFFDLASGRARLWVDATTPTSVGDVDVHVRFTQSQWNDFGPMGNFFTTSNNRVGIGLIGIDNWWGVWHITPEMSLSAGAMDNGADYGQGETFGTTVNLIGSTVSTDEQLRLTYASGPVSFFIAADDGNEGLDSTPDVTANVTWAGDMFTFGLGGYFAPTPGDDVWAIGGNISGNVTDAVNLHVSAQVGTDFGTIAGGNNNGMDYWGVAGGIKANVNEATYVELTGGYKDTDFYTRWNVNGGVYYAPVSQLTLGLEADYTSQDNVGPNNNADYASASFVTWFRF